MTLPAPNKNRIAQGAAEAQTAATGWDPFEVWRTRVLLPRLAESRDSTATSAAATSAAAPSPPPSVKLVRP
jgi:hypothetical protein